MSDQWTQIETLFENALDLPAEDRTAWLDAHCTDPAICHEVRSLLQAADKADAFLEEPAQVFAADLVAGEEEQPQRVGPYRLLRQIGRGGMGAVYLAERDDEQFDQQVAVKLLRRDTSRSDLHDRFLAERQILASLSQPNIARLYDGGVTVDGQPYFVMEYIDGQPLDAYCDAKRLSIDERLRLFVAACEAVHHAHQNLIVHRDLKPSNILVTDEGALKLLDFGIAKLLDENAPAVPVTQTGQRLMTPEYASPEQVKGEPITTASDVYQLGVVLYELLTGHRPYAASGRSAYEIQQAVCEEEPTRPSTAVQKVASVQQGETTEALTPEAVSRARGLEADALQRTLSGDLDAIVLKALRKEPPSRYASAEAFVEDVKRYLAALPVEARQGTVGYRVRKFARRNRWGVAAAVVFLLLLAGYAATVTVQAQQIAEERDRAQQEAAKAEQVTAFLAGFFQANNPSEAQGDTLTVRDILNQGTVRIEEELGDQPAVQAEMLEVVGEVYRQLGEYDKAQPLFEKSLQVRRDLYPEPHPDLAESIHSLGSLFRNTADYAAAESLYQEALAMRRSLSNGKPTQDLAVNLSDLSILRSRQGNYDGAEELAQEAIAIYRELYEGEHEYLATSLNNLATVLYRKEDYTAAAPLYEEALAMHRKLLGDSHPNVAGELNNLANLYYNLERYDRAEELRRETLRLDRKLFGDQHRYVAMDLNSLGLIRSGQGYHKEAEALLREAVAMYRATVGDEHPDVAYGLYGLGSVLLKDERLDEAEKALQEALALRRKLLGEVHPTVAATLNQLGTLYNQQGKHRLAETHYRRAIAVRKETVEGGEGLAIMYSNLGDVLYEIGNWAGADSLYRAALQVYREEGAPVPQDMAEVLTGLGKTLVQQDQMEEAESLLMEGYDMLRETPRDTAKATREVLTGLVMLYEAWDKPDEATSYRVQLQAASGSS